MHGRIGDWWKTEADIFSLEGLILWLKKQPEDKVYCYDDNTKCLQAQYFAAVGKPIACLGNILVTFEGEYKSRRIPETFHEIAVTSPWTFGAALARARAVQP